MDGTPRGDGHRTMESMESPASTEETDSSGVIGSGTATPLSTLPKPSPEKGEWVSNYYSRQFEGNDDDDDDDGPRTGASDTTLVLGQSSPAPSDSGSQPSPLPVEYTQLESEKGPKDDEESNETNTAKSEQISPLNLDLQFREQAESGTSDIDDPELNEKVALPQ